ncbi:39S ribosomal protein L37 [Mactra antiquata]
MVRLSSILCRSRFARQQKQAFQRKGVYYVRNSPSLSQGILQESGANVADPRPEINPPPPEWIPPAEMLDDFRINFPPPQDHRKKDKSIWHLSSRISLTEGIDQACLLTKTQRFNGLPPQIERLVDKYSLTNQDEKIKDVIRHAMTWNNTNKKLPRRIDFERPGYVFTREYGIPNYKSICIMLENYIRLSQSFGGAYPELTASRRLVCKPSIETSYEYQNETIEIRALNDYIVNDRRPLNPLGNDQMIAESVNHELLDMYPVSPTVDLLRTDIYEDLNRGAFKEMLRIPCSHPQIVFRINSGRGREANQAFNLMTTFGIAITEARSRYGIGMGKLEVPVTIINMNISFNRINYIVFQLNTMDFDNDEGIKNLAWFDSELMFRKHPCKQWLEADNKIKPAVYNDYNKKAFSKFLALYLYDYVN